MRKEKKEFHFNYPLQHKVVKNLKIVTEHVGDLMIDGVGYFNPSASRLDITDRYAVDIDFVKWNGTDIKPVLEVTGQMEDIEEAAVRYFAGILEKEMDRAA
jgi:hypothetical protein